MENEFFSDEIIEMQYLESEISLGSSFTPFIGYLKNMNVLAYYVPDTNQVAFYKKKRNSIRPINSEIFNSKNYRMLRNIIDLEEEGIEEFIEKTSDEWMVLHPRYSWIKGGIMNRIQEKIENVAGKCEKKNEIHYPWFFDENTCRYCGKELSEDEAFQLDTIESVL